MPRRPAVASPLGLLAARSEQVRGPKPIWALFVVSACILLGTPHCYAGFPHGQVTTVLAGPVAGPTFDADGPTLVHAGAEVSMVHFNLDNGLWYGGYADALYTVERTRFSLGPEVGFTFGGVDGGLLLRDDGELGFTVRPLLSLALVSLYYRYGHYLTAQESFHALGIMIKLPLLRREEGHWESAF